MRFVDHDQVPAGLPQIGLLATRELVGAHDDRVLLKRVQIARTDGSVEAAGLQDGARQVELVGQLLRPLLAQVGRHDHQHLPPALGPLLRQEQPSLNRLPQPHFVGENRALGERAAEGEERRLNLVGVEIDLRVSKNRRELLDAARRAALGDLVGEVLGVEVGDHERRALPFGSRGRHVAIRYIMHNACAAQRAMVTPSVVLTTANPGRRSAHVRVR